VNEQFDRLRMPHHTRTMYSGRSLGAWHCMLRIFSEHFTVHCALLLGALGGAHSNTQKAKKGWG
jgi:hypothetical protein